MDTMSRDSIGWNNSLDVVFAKKTIKYLNCSI